MCRSISSIRPRSSSCRPMVGENTSTFFPPAASSAICTASSTGQLRTLMPSAGRASSGWCVSTKTGPCHAPP